MKPNRPLRHEWLLTLPSFAWLTVLFVVPCLLVFAIAFRPADLYGGVGPGWTLETWRGLWNPYYPVILARTVWISVAATVWCLLLAVPVGYCMARSNPRWRRILVLLTVVPFWISFLVRVFAWKHLLHPDGMVRQALVAIGLIAPETSLLYTTGTVLMVTVYSLLPFAILPVYAAAEKFDYQLMEAALDLGATRWGAFCRVFLPGIRRGIVTAILVVLIPGLGSYIIPDVVGGVDSEMIGNKIAQRTFVDRNLPHAGALSSLLTLAVLAPMVVVVLNRTRGGKRSTVRVEEGV